MPADSVRSVAAVSHSTHGMFFADEKGGVGLGATPDIFDNDSIDNMKCPLRQ